MNDKIFNKVYIYNYKEYDINKILNETIDNISFSKKLYSFITNGDPTDTNISVDGFFLIMNVPDLIVLLEKLLYLSFQFYHMGRIFIQNIIKVFML